MGKGQEECKTFQYFIYLFFFYFFFRFNRDLIFFFFFFFSFLWSLAGLQSIPYWRSHHGYQQKKSCCIKHEMKIIAEAGLLPLMDSLR